MSIFDSIVKSQLNKSGFIKDDYKSYSYLDLLNEYNKFKKLNLSTGLIINICENNFDFLSGYVSFLNLRYCQLLLDSEIDNKFLLNIIQRYRPKYIFAPKEKSLFSYKKIILKKKNYNLYELEFDEYTINKKIAILLSTSGTTGSQKFVKLSRNNIINNTKNICKYLKISKFDTTITTMPPSYSYGLSIINSHLFKNANLIFTKKRIVEKKFWNIFKKNKITNFNGVPILYEILLKLGLNNLYSKNLKFLTSAGGQNDRNKLEKIIEFCEEKKISFYSMYGQTEASPRISYIKYPQKKNKIGSIGKPIPEGKLFIKNKELIYKGKNIFHGYSESYKDLFKVKNYKYLYTGDLGFKDNGYFFITGRKKRIIKIFGYRISLDELENEILNKGYKCAIKEINEKLKIFHQKNVSGQLISKFLIEKFKIPKNRIILKKIIKLPMTLNNKVDYNKL